MVIPRPFAPNLRQLGNAAQRVQDLVGLEGLDEEIRRLNAHRVDRGLKIGKGRDQDRVGKASL
ncbi:hypothetical protein [Silicibacter sp. TrichCH4B]|uniref:hypothetical protein n=1 Tax=Tritonibacter mobilis TaxID=379347 RepID=UPI000587139D